MSKPSLNTSLWPRKRLILVGKPRQLFQALANHSASRCKIIFNSSSLYWLLFQINDSHRPNSILKSTLMSGKTRLMSRSINQPFGLTVGHSVCGLCGLRMRRSLRLRMRSIILVLGAEQIIEYVDDGGDVALWLAVAILEGRVQGTWKKETGQTRVTHCCSDYECFKSLETRI